MTASKLILGMLCLTLAWPSLAQDRRRPGERPDRGPAQEAPVQREAPSPSAPDTAPDADEPTVQRRRPGEAPVERVEPAAPTPRRDDTAERRRPAQPDVTRRTERRERPSPDAPVRDREPFDFNRASGLAAVDNPPADAEYRKEAVPDRWQLTRQLGLSDYPIYDPYNQNTLKGDRPLHDDWFFNFSLISDTVIEPRQVATPTGPSGDTRPDELSIIGGFDQTVFAQTLIASAVYYKGNTTFKPPDWEYRLTVAYQYNHVSADQDRALLVDPRDGSTRTDNKLAIQEAFVDYHIRNVSARYDFDSIRVGIQPFTADFRGFLFQDLQLGVRLFGTRDDNFWQYNLAWFRRIEKDTNSGLNAIDKSLRSDDVFVANLYRQDWPMRGFTSQGVVLHNRNRDGEDGSHFNENGFIERPASIGREVPRNYDVTYLGYNGDGHLGRLNLSAAAYYAIGRGDTGVFVDEEVDIRAYFAAFEAGMDLDWRRLRLSALYASPDRDPFDTRETGFDAVFENPQFAGFDTSYWIRQNVPLLGGGRVGVSGRNGVLNSLRSTKEEGQSNFANPGTMLLGLGADLDLTPQFRVSFNANQIWFADTSVVEVARQQAGIDRDIGLDLSVATVWRPFMTQNVILRTSAATLLPGKGYKQLFGDSSAYSILVNLVLNY